MRPDKPFIKQKISFCTVCMNKKHHLQKTLPKNIESNLEYGNIEFVLLDYNSKDGLEEYVKTELKEYVDKGILVYVKTTEPEYFHRSHSRNVAFNASSGDIICNVDADNFIGASFASYINNQFNRYKNIFLIPDSDSCIGDVVGRVCVKKADFDRVQGYDESISDYGFEDQDLYNRLKMIGKREKFIKKNSYLQAVLHDKVERYKFEKQYNTLKSIYLNYISVDETEVVIFNKDNTYKRCILKNKDKIEGTDPMDLLDKPGLFGTWFENETQIQLIEEGSMPIILKKINNLEVLTNRANQDYYLITDVKFLSSLYLKLSLITNNEKLRRNLKKNNSRVNSANYGKANLIKNFTQNIQI